MVTDGSVSVSLERTGARFNKPRDIDGSMKDIGIGKFFLSIDVVSLKAPIYVPVSIASGKKTVGFIYQIEGTDAGEIGITEVACHGDGITKVTLGTLLYARIPALKTGSFKMEIEISGRLKKEYRIALNQMSYKLDPADSRYKKLELDIGTKWLKFE